MKFQRSKVNRGTEKIVEQGNTRQDVFFIQNDVNDV